MDKKELAKEYLSCLNRDDLSSSERIEKLKKLQKEIDNENSILGLDSDYRNQIIEEAKQSLQDDAILRPYVEEEIKSILNNDEIVRR